MRPVCTASQLSSGNPENRQCPPSIPTNECLGINKHPDESESVTLRKSG
jgi:hypothetical protein